MHIMQGNSKKIYINFCNYIMYISIICNRTFSHDEKDYGQPAILHVWDTKIYDDNTIVARIVRVNTTTENTTCFYETFSLRIIHPDGTVDEKDIKLDIQPFNYCILSTLGPIGMKNGKPILFLDFIDYHLIRKNHILITYYNATDPVDHYTYEEWGMVIDLDNKVLDRTPFGFVFFNLMPDSRIKLNINREKGFLRLANSSDAKMEWQQYKIESDGKFTKLTTGILEFVFPNLTSTMISTVDENYAIAYADSNSLENPLSPQAQLFVLPIGYNQRPTSPLLLYQNFLPNSIFIGLSCDIAFAAGVGQVCILAVHQSIPPYPTFYVKIDFLSSGSVTNFTVINIDKIEVIFDETDGNIDSAWLVNNLPFGGYLVTRYFFSSSNSGSFGTFEPIYIYGYLFGDNDTNYTKWEFDEPIKETYGVFQVLHNYTLLIATRETKNSWQFQAIDLPVLSGKSYSNVEATFPVIESSINPNIPKISIDFYNPVDLSIGNLSIYQVIDGRQYIRQSIPSELCTISHDGKTVSADVLESTFSVSKGSYSIEMDNNFVRDKALNEPSSGIRENVWRFTTEEKKDAFAPSTTGLLRLTPEGTQKFDDLSRDERRDFFSNLLKEMSESIPISLSRLTTVGKAQLDNRLSEKQYLISIRINETRDEYDNSVESIFRIIDTMVKYKDQTPIGSGYVTRYLDESYGFIRLPDLWKTYKINLIGLSLIVGLLICLFILAERRSHLLKKKEKKGGKEDEEKYNNIVILQLGVIIFDLIMDILFVRINSRDISGFYIPSVVFLTLPITINAILTFDIITRENAEPEFYQWFIKNANIASIITVLASADIAALNILKSNLAGFQSFNAPFSDFAKSKIVWGNFLNIFTEDIPQLIIQIYYRHNAVSYDVIPLLSLISSSVNLVVHIIGIFYEITLLVDVPEYVPNIPNDGEKDDFLDADYYT